MCKLQCREAALSVGLANMETTDRVLRAPHGCFLISTAKNYSSFLILKELRRNNGSSGWEQHFSSLPSASILDDRTDLQSGIRHFLIPPLPRQLVVVPPRSSKAQAGSWSGCWTLLLSWLLPSASQTTTSKHCWFPSGSQRFPGGLLWVIELQNSLNKTPIKDCTRKSLHHNCTNLLFHGSPAWAPQTPCSQFHSTHWGQAWHIPLQPLTFPLSLNCSTPRRPTQVTPRFS